MEEITVEQLADDEFDEIGPLLVELQLGEQTHFADHPQLSRRDIERELQKLGSSFEGENIIFATRRNGRLAGFCWCVLFDPGTGLEGEVAELYVAEGERGRGVGQALLTHAIQLFRERGVTLGYVWTRPDNDAAVRLYRSAGFNETRQLVLTWYPL